MLTLLPTPLGNLEDITFRALKALQKAKVLVCEDTRVAKQLLTLLSKRFQVSFEIKEFYSLHSHNQKQFFSSIHPSFFEQNVVYMSDAGMPGISDPGSELVRYAQEHNISYTVLPGPSAAITAFAASGFEGAFGFYGFLPHKGEVRKKQLQQILDIPLHIILYEAPHRLLKLLEELTHLVPERTIFLAKELTKMYEHYYKASATILFNQLQKEAIRGEWVVVIEKMNEKRKSAKLCLGVEEIMALSLAKKEKAKLLAQISNKSVKEWYSILNNS